MPSPRAAANAKANLMRFAEIDEFGLVTPTPPFIFRINPSELKVSIPKVERYVLTKAGYERQFWQNGLWNFSYSGTSGFFNGAGSALGTQFDLRNTAAYLKFKELRDRYLRFGPLSVRMTYWEYDFPFEGSLDKFDYEFAPNKSHSQMPYSFTFIGLPLDYRETAIQTPGIAEIQTPTLGE